MNLFLRSLRDRALRLVVGAVSLAGLALAAGSAQALPVVVVTNDASSAVSETANAAIIELQRLGIASEDIVREKAANVGRSPRPEARAYVTLGVEALREVLKANVREPVVAALIPRAALEAAVSETGRRGNLTALYLDQPWARQMALVRLALPDARRVGVVLGPESQAQQTAVTAAIRGQGLEPIVGVAINQATLFSGLKPALEDSDVLFAVPDAMVYNNATVPSILMATYRARIPMVAFSPAYVKAGALLCVYSTPVQIGGQAALMLQAILRGTPVASQYPQDYVVRVNDSVARSLGLVLREDALTEQLRRQERKP